MFNAIESLFVQEAWAMAPPQQGAEGGATSTIMGFLPLIIIFVIFYFLIIRPQSKRQKEVETMQSGLKKGDKVITTSGIYGLVEEVRDKTVTLKIAEDTRVKFGKSYVAMVRTTAEEE